MVVCRSIRVAISSAVPADFAFIIIAMRGWDIEETPETSNVNALIAILDAVIGSGANASAISSSNITWGDAPSK